MKTQANHVATCVLVGYPAVRARRQISRASGAGNSISNNYNERNPTDPKVPDYFLINFVASVRQESRPQLFIAGLTRVYVFYVLIFTCWAAKNVIRIIATGSVC